MDPHDVGNNFIHETPIMGDQHHFMGPIVQKALDPANGGNVQKVGGFIEQQ